MRRGVVIPCGAVALLLSLAASVHAQQQDFYFYHGRNNSTLVTPGGANGYERSGQRVITVRALSGSQVCVHVVNSHPVYYSYSLGRSVDTTIVKLPNFSNQVTLLQPLLTHGRSTPRTLDDIDSLAATINSLSKDLDSANAYVRQGDNPEQIADLDHQASDLAAGFRYTQYRVAHMSAAPGRFNDKDLSSTLKTLVSNARTEADGNDALKDYVAAIEAHANSLASDVEAIRTTFADDVPAETQVCEQVGTGPTTFQLKIGLKNPDAVRDRGDMNFSIVARPPYVRPFISLHPIAFASIGSRVPDFRVIDGTLEGDPGYKADFRVGAIVDFNLANFGADDVFGMGAGLGLGTQAKKEVLSDIFVGPVFSYRDDARVGFGIGASKFPRRVTGAQVGTPFTAEGELSSLVEDDYTLAFQLIFVLPGIILNK